MSEGLEKERIRLFKNKFLIHDEGKNIFGKENSYIDQRPLLKADVGFSRDDYRFFECKRCASILHPIKV